MRKLCALCNERENIKQGHNQIVEIGQIRLLQFPILFENSSPIRNDLMSDQADNRTFPYSRIPIPEGRLFCATPAPYAFPTSTSPIFINENERTFLPLTPRRSLANLSFATTLNATTPHIRKIQHTTICESAEKRQAEMFKILGTRGPTDVEVLKGPIRHRTHLSTSGPGQNDGSDPLISDGSRPQRGDFY